MTSLPPETVRPECDSAKTQHSALLTQIKLKKGFSGYAYKKPFDFGASSMSLYRCVCYTELSLQPGLKPIHAGSDSQARQIALDMLRQNPALDRLEVWRDSDLAFRLNRRQARIESTS